MAKFTIKGREFSSGKLDVFKQAYVSKRLAPVLNVLPNLAGLNLSTAKIKKDDAGNVVDVDFDGDLTPVISSFTAALSSMPDADLEFIFCRCLEVTQVKQPTGWAFAHVSGNTMFEFTLPELIEITVRVLAENLANFTPGQLSLTVLADALGVTLPG